MTKREKAMRWWNNLSNIEKNKYAAYYSGTKNMSKLLHHSVLTGSIIQSIYEMTYE